MSLESIFQKKYVEFCNDLSNTYPEKSDVITLAKELSAEDRIRRFRTEVLPNCKPARDPSVNPRTVLPGLLLEDEHWDLFSKNTKKAIQEYLTLLSFCSMLDSSAPGLGGGLHGDTQQKVFLEAMMGQWKSKLNKLDFSALSEKMMSIFGAAGLGGAAGAAGAAGGFKIPEKMLKGQLAKLAEEIVRDFKPEDFGLTPEEMNESEKNPSRAFELLMQIYSQKPELLQNAMKKIAKRLQEKVRSGQLKPQDLAAEAEEMMKDFSENPAFVEIMEAFRGMFSFEDPELAKSTGRDGSGRLALARNRLRAKLDAKKKAADAK